MSYAPIVIFTHDRPDHVRKTVEALLQNQQAEYHDLVIYSDAARIPEKQGAVERVRGYLLTIKGFRSVTIHLRPHNFGLAKSIIEGVTQVLSEYENIIVLEDDMITSPYFLTYMNEALTRFSNDERVISIHGYCYPVEQLIPEAFFLRGADCWGWATWRRGWTLFNPDGEHLLKELERRKLLKTFDFNDTYAFSRMLKDQINGKNDSWAIRWYASAFLADKLTLYPGKSLVHNIGNDSSGTHCGNDETLDVKLSQSPIRLSEIEVMPSELGHSAFENFFKKNQSSFSKKLTNTLKKILTKVFE